MATRRTLSFLFRMKKWVNIRPEWRQTFDALCESLGNVFPRTGLPSHDDDEDEKPISQSKHLRMVQSRCRCLKIFYDDRHVYENQRPA